MEKLKSFYHKYDYHIFDNFIGSFMNKQESEGIREGNQRDRFFDCQKIQVTGNQRLVNFVGAPERTRTFTS